MVNGMTTFPSSSPAQRHDDVYLLSFGVGFKMLWGRRGVDLGNATFFDDCIFFGGLWRSVTG